MNQVQLLKEIRKELKKNIDIKHRDGARNFFKEEHNNYGVLTPVVRKIANKYWQQIKHFSKEEIFTICEKLLKSLVQEDSIIAFSWTYRLKDQYQIKDFKIFESWVKKYVDNWAKCDDFCTHSVGHLIYRYPQLTEKLFVWAQSKNRWLKRAAAVTLIYPIKKKTMLKIIFKMAKTLLEDDDDLVQKGYGWMLKEASNIYQQPVFNFVIKHKSKMPRTALRYAIEKMPLRLKKQAIARD